MAKFQVISGEGLDAAAQGGIYHRLHLLQTEN